MAGTDQALKKLLTQLDGLIAGGQELIASYGQLSPGAPRNSTAPEEQLRAFVTLAAVVVDRVTGTGSQFQQNIPVAPPLSTLRDSFGRDIISTTVGVLIALRTAVYQGLLVSLESRLRASIRDDFLVQASDLLDSDYPIPALMLTSAVLENHLNNMIEARGLSVTGKRSLSKYNDLLHKDGAYLQSVWRCIQSIGDHRNDGAHGKFSTVSRHEAQDTHAYVQRFMADYPA